ncbi:SMI1/KNR4 family protein [Sorangium sp. So ce861]|uniref:SMI1/KNR4 family protein n=1 Tax=Sorangium sp. So ce861 TaxID=3133323 RepID=UPI003F6104B6
MLPAAIAGSGAVRGQRAGPAGDLNMSTDEVTRAWARIDAWLAEHAPPIAADLRPPATDEQIARLEALGFAYPDELAASLRVHDGQGPYFGQSALGTWAAHSCDDIAGLWAMYGEQAADRSPVHDEGIIADPGVRPRSWHERWIPFAINGDGDALVVDVDPAPGGAVGQIVRLHHDADGTRTCRLEAPSLATWLSELADQMEAGAWEVIRGGKALRRRKAGRT